MFLSDKQYPGVLFLRIAFVDTFLCHLDSIKVCLKSGPLLPATGHGSKTALFKFLKINPTDNTKFRKAISRFFVFSWRHGGHISVSKQRHESHVDVPD